MRFSLQIDTGDDPPPRGGWFWWVLGGLFLLYITLKLVDVTALIRYLIEGGQ